MTKRKLQFISHLFLNRCRDFVEHATTTKRRWQADNADAENDSPENGRKKSRKVTSDIVVVVGVGVGVVATVISWSVVVQLIIDCQCLWTKNNMLPINISNNPLKEQDYSKLWKIELSARCWSHQLRQRAVPWSYGSWWHCCPGRHFQAEECTTSTGTPPTRCLG